MDTQSMSARTRGRAPQPGGAATSTMSARPWRCRAAVVVLFALLAAYLPAVIGGGALPAAQAVTNADLGGAGVTGTEKNEFLVYTTPGETLTVSIEHVFVTASWDVPTEAALISPTGDLTRFPTGGGSMVIPIDDTNDGVWVLVISQERTNYNWEVTISDSNGDPIPGRLWSEAYFQHNYGGTGGRFYDLSFWIVNDSGYLYNLQLHQYNGIYSRIIANSVGWADPANGCAPTYQSLRETSSGANLLDCGETYRIFFDRPADDLPEYVEFYTTNYSVTGTPVLTGSYVVPTPLELTNGAGTGVADTSTLAYTQTGTTAEGDFAATIDPRFSGGYWLQIDADGDGIYDNDCSDPEDAGPVDVCIRAGATGSSDPYITHWDGKDNRGNDVPASVVINAQLYFASVGEVHIMQYDVEGRGGISLIRDSDGDARIYWDDTALSSAGVLNVTTTNGVELLKGEGVDSTGTDVHGWGFGTDSWGDKRWIDDWTYLEQVGTSPAITFARSAAAVEKTVEKDDDAQPGDRVVYTVKATNSGAMPWNPLSAPTVADDLSDVIDDGVVAVDDITATVFHTDGTTTDVSDQVVWDAATSMVTWKLRSGTLAPGAYVEIDVPVDLVSSGDRDVLNVAWLNPPGAPVPEEAPACDDASVSASCVQYALPALSVAKTATSDDADLASGEELPIGTQMTYQITVTNTGETAYRADNPASVTDDLSAVLDEATMVGTPSAGSGTVSFDADAKTLAWSGPLAAGASETITYTVEYQGGGDRTLVNRACVDEEHAVVGERCIEVQTPGGGVAAATLDKTAEITTDNGTAGVADQGDVVTYSFVVENTGSVVLDDVFVEDEMIAAQIGADALTAACSVASLAPGETLECSVAYTVTAADIATAGSTLVNVATAAATPAEDVPFTEPTDDASVDKPAPAPGIEVVKDATPDAGLGLGDAVQYGFTVTNTGNVELTGVTVTDPMVGNVTCEATTLAPDASTACTADTTYTITEADLLAGLVENTATASGTAPDGSSTEDTGSKTVTTATPVAALGLVKHADFVVDEGEQGLADAGDQLRFWFEVTNSGAVTVENVAISDEMVAGLGLDIVCTPSTLAPLDVATCAVSGDYTVTEADVMAGMVRNVATATADVPDGVDPIDPPEDTTETPTVPAAPGLSIVKTAALTDANGNGKADVGERVQYSFVVENTGNVTVDQIEVTDPLLAGMNITCDATSLAPGVNTDCRAEGVYTVTDQDVVAGVVHNEATAAGKTPDGGDVSGVDTEDVPTVEASAALDVVKTATLTDANDNGIADKGEEITYTFTVTNTGTVTLTDLSVADEMLADAGVEVACEATELSPGVGTTCSVSGPYTVTAADEAAGQVENTATGTAKDPEGGDVTDEGSTTTPVLTPASAITVEKIATPVDTNSNGVLDLGEQITYSFTVTNNGNVPLTGLVLTDSLLAEIGVTVTCEAADLAVGASTSCAASGPYAVTESDILAGVVHNEATGTATAPDGGEVSDGDTADETTAAPGPSLELVKTATPLVSDGDGALEVGERVTYGFTVTNIGNVALTGVDIADSLLGEAGITVSCDVVDLGPGEVASCVASGPYTVTDADVLAGVVHNEADVTATDPNGDDVSDDATADVDTIAPAAGIEIVKDAALADSNTNGVADLGETVLYTFTVTNTGSLTLTDVTVSDPMLTGLGIDVTCETTTLAPRASTSCTAGDVYTVTEADVLVGKVANTATVTGTPAGGGEDVTDEGEKEVPTAPAGAGIEVVKTATLADANTNGAGDLGEQITYSFTVTNTGNVTLTDVRVEDPMLAAAGITVSCEPVELAPGGSATCTASGAYTIAEADVLAGVVSNTATATGTPAGGGEGVTDEGTADVTTGAPVPGIEVVKSSTLADTNSNGVGDLGEQITYSFTVKNTGNVTLTGVTVDDPMLAAAGITVACTPGDLAPGASALCAPSGSYTITEADVLAGGVFNVASATGTTPPGGGEPPVDEDDDEVPSVDPAPGIEVVKTASLADTNTNALGDLGEQITYSFQVRNTGNVTLTDVRVDDPMLAAAGITVVCEPTTLAPGGVVNCAASGVYTIAEADLLAGQVRNVATATGTPPEGVEPPSDEDDTTTGTPVAGPSLLLVKSADLVDSNGNGKADLGEEITYSFAVTNNGNVTITDLTVEDPMLAAAGITVVCDPTDLAPGESADCAASKAYPVTEADVLAGQVANHATVTGEDPAGGPVSDEDEEIVPSAGSLPGIEVVKASDLADANGNALADVGEQVTYSFAVTNTGNVTLTDVSVDDPKLTAAGISVVCEPTALVPGDSADCVASGPYTVTEADVLAGGVFNVASATGATPPGGGEPPVDEDDDEVPSVDPAPGIEVVKSASLADTNDNGLADLGETISYSFEVTNTGNVTLTDVRVDDPMLAAAGITVVCEPTTLAPGEAADCTVSGSYAVTEADVLAGSVRNVATATGTPPEGVNPPVDEDGTVTGTPVPAASLLLDKVSDLADTNGNGKADAGEEVTYSFVVVNNGNVTITDVTVDDAMLDAVGIAVACDPSMLAPGESVTCEASGSYPVTEADVLAGGVVNHATVTGSGPGGQTPTDEDGDEVPTVDPVPGIEVVKSSDLADVNDNGKADLGEEIAYSFRVTNTGNVTLTGVRVDDPKLAAAGVEVVCEPGVLAPGGSVVCEASGPYTVTEADVLAGVVVNHATATGTTPPGGGEPPADEDSDEVPSVEPAPALSLDKVSRLNDANGNGLADLGETVSYGFTVTNTGNVTVLDVAVVDQMLVDAGIGVTCDALVVAPGDSVSCKADAVYPVTEADLLAGSVHNVATVTGRDPGGEPVDPPTDETVERTADPAPGLGLVKHADLADVNGNGKADLGEEISFWFEVSNTGNVTITGVAVDDPMLAALGVAITCEATDLVPGAGTRCEASVPYTVTEADILAGSVRNVATATGAGPGGEEVDPPTDETETPTPGKDGRLSLVKHADLADANGNGLADVGEQVTYGFAVRNVGNVTVSDIAIVDEMLADAGIEVTCEEESLAPGASMTCTASAPYTVTDADVEAGSVLNQATATGVDPDEEPIVPPADEKEVPTPQPDASLLLEKVSTLADANDNGLADAGEQVAYGFVVTNNGNVTITDVHVDDPKLAGLGMTVTCDLATLAPGASVTCAASGAYTVTEADVVAGGVLNHATVTGTGPGGQIPTDEDEDEVPTPTPAPALTLEKSSTLVDANGNGLADAGEKVTYQFLVTNTGNVTISDVSVADEKLAALGIDVVCEITSLAPGESVTCTASDVYTVTEADVIAGMVINHATTTGTGPGGETPTGEDGDEVPTPEPVTGLTLVKQDRLVDANRNGLADVGEQVTYTFEVTNTGNITVTDLKVDDPKLAQAGIAVTCDPTTLAPGESVTCTAPAYTVTQADVAAGAVVNTATATGTTPEGVDDPIGEDTVTTKTGPKFTSGVLSAGNGPLSALAVTGATVQVAALAALALLGLGVLLVTRTRRTGRQEG